jgi:hypothetical protein
LFERYTERARRSIFFARYESSRFGSQEIKAEELLLGILREDKTVAMRLGMGALEAIRNEVEQLAPKRESVSTSVDLPLSLESQRALAYAAEEAAALDHKHIGAPHLVLGLLRVEDSLAAKLLRKHGMEYKLYRRIVDQGVPQEVVRERPRERPLERQAAWNELEPVAPQAESLAPAIRALQQMVDSTAAHVDAYTDSYADRRLKREPWTRKEALGHLIDWTIAHQQWLTAALMESKLKTAGYPDEGAVAVQHYSDFPWAETVDLWVSSNRLLIHVLMRVPEDKLDVPCRIGIAEPVPLTSLIDAYLEHCQDVVGQILSRLD